MKFASILALAALTPGYLLARPAETDSREFVESIYRGYSSADAPSILGRHADAIFSPALLGRIRSDQQAHPGQVGKLDHDPLCDCQDADGLRQPAVAVTPLPDGRERADVTFRLGETEKALTLKLVHTQAGWRVDDVSSAGMPSLQRYLGTPMPR